MRADLDGPEILRDLEMEAEIDPQIQTEATTLAQVAADAEDVRGKPSAIAAACIYELGQRRERQWGWSQDDIADAANVSAGALRGHWKTIQDLGSPR